MLQQLGNLDDRDGEFGVPLYLQIAAALREAIQADHFSTGALPTAMQLSEHFGVAQMTVRRAIGELRDAGLVTPRQGKGVFVRKPAAPTVQRTDQAVEEITARLPSPEEADAAIASGRRSRQGDGVKLQLVGTVERRVPPYVQIAAALREAIQADHFSTGMLPTAMQLSEHFGVARMTVRRAIGELRDAGLVTPRQGKGVFVRKPAAPTVQRTGHVVAEAITARLPSPEEADALGIALDTPVLAVSRRVSNAAGVVVALSDSVLTSTYTVEYHDSDMS